MQPSSPGAIVVSECYQVLEKQWQRLNARPICTVYNDIVVAICPIVRQLKESYDVAGIVKSIASPGARCVLNLDDAVTVLRSLGQTSPNLDNQLITKALMDSAVNKTIRSFFGAHEVKGSKNTDKKGRTVHRGS